MRIIKYFGYIGVVLMIALSATACGNAAANTAGTKQVACDKVASATEQAQAKVDKAQAKSNKSKGSPAEKDDAKALKSAQQDLDALRKRSDECGTTPTTLVSQKNPDQCVEGYSVALDQNEGNKVISAAQAELPMDNPPAAVDVLMKYAQHDPRILQLYWNASPLGKDAHVDDWHTLVDNGCYTPQARDLFNQTLAQYKSATVTKSDAPATGVNTGVMANGGQAFQEKPGKITGNREAVQITFLNGDVIWVMHRCGNVVTKRPIPGIPQQPQPQQPQCVPPAHPSPVKPDVCVVPKDPSKDVLVNPAVPDQVKGPGTTPVGGDPGPATQPVDSPTGCNGPCPSPTTQPTSSPSTTTSTTAPPTTTPASGTTATTSPSGGGNPPPPPSG